MKLAKGSQPVEGGQLATAGSFGYALTNVQTVQPGDIEATKDFELTTSY